MTNMTEADLQHRLTNAEGFSNEIDQALGRIAGIERHLGMTAKIAA